MQYEIEKYQIVKPTIKALCESKPDRRPIELIGELSLATECPIVVVCYFIKELYGESEELTAKTEYLEKFYQITK